MDDPNIILTLAANTAFTEHAFQLDHNQLRYRAPRVVEDVWEPWNLVEKHRLMLSFDLLPNCRQKGFVFGSSPMCDVQLVDSKATHALHGRTVHEEHFAIGFDDQRLIVVYALPQASQTLGEVTFQSGIEGPTTLSEFRLYSYMSNVTVRIPNSDISITVQAAKHEESYQEYVHNINFHLPWTTDSWVPIAITPATQLNATTDFSTDSDVVHPCEEYNCFLDQLCNREDGEADQHTFQFQLRHGSADQTLPRLPHEMFMLWKDEQPSTELIHQMLRGLHTGDDDEAVAYEEQEDRGLQAQLHELKRRCETQVISYVAIYYDDDESIQLRVKAGGSEESAIGRLTLEERSGDFVELAKGLNEMLDVWATVELSLIQQYL